MDLMDLLKEADAGSSIAKIGDRLNLGSAETRAMIDAVAPALKRSLQKEVQSPTGLASLALALENGDHAKYVERPEVLETEAAVQDGNRILGHLFGSKDVSRNVAANAAQQTGISADLIKKALPLLAGLAMGALSKKSDGGRASTSVLSSLFGDDDGDFGIDDVLGLARKFF
ncbi:MAG: DUF937 domain-containing protein [Woeseiaceae bacterium]|nr:DUF937 domain-containing protein [Woeseiaceae bacterium]